jgi:hypothetical protein
MDSDETTRLLDIDDDNKFNTSAIQAFAGRTHDLGKIQ